MYKFKAIVTVFGFSLFSMVSYAGSPIEEVCSQSVKSSFQSKNPLLDKLFKEFGNQKQREKNPEELVLLLDSILNGTEFSNVISCKKLIEKDPNFSFSIAFQDPQKGNQSMDVTTDYQENGSVKLTLGFNLVKSAQRVLFVYLHEMTHVCQGYKATSPVKKNLIKLWDRLSNNEKWIYQNVEMSMWGEYDQRTQDKLKSLFTVHGEMNRLWFFGEIEAFYNMQKAYEYFIKESSILCTDKGLSEEEKPDQPLYETYLESQKQLEYRTFTQMIVQGYLDHYEPKSEFLFDLSTPEKIYTSFDGQVFKMHDYNDSFKALLQSAKIPF